MLTLQPQIFPLPAVGKDHLHMHRPGDWSACHPTKHRTAPGSAGNATAGSRSKQIDPFSNAGFLLVVDAMLRYMMCACICIYIYIYRKFSKNIFGRNYKIHLKQHVLQCDFLDTCVFQKRNTNTIQQPQWCAPNPTLDFLKGSLWCRARIRLSPSMWWADRNATGDDTLS